jgi:hypothetical protein
MTGPKARRRYQVPDANTARWEGFAFRPGDIIIDAPSKSGTTWTQLLVALLVFGGPEFPQPLGVVSPWMEQRIRSVGEAHEMLAGQQHRRFIKSHSPLDGIPQCEEVRYVCVGRDPRDAAVSMRHHAANMRRARLRELITPQLNGEELPPIRPPLDEDAYFDRWIDTDDPDEEWSVHSLVHHYKTFWDRRSQPNVALFHFADYLEDLPSALIRLAEHLDIDLSPARAEALANEASINRARERARDIAPEAHLDIWEDPAAFFRNGSAGQWRDRMSPAQQERYEVLVATLGSPELVYWIHHGGPT